jgi:hypothetical protein
MLPVFNQARFPQAGDVDDCWVVATIWAAKSVAPAIAVPDAKRFREAARDPDDGVRDGGNNDEMALAVRTLWPHIPLIDFRSARWDRFMGFVREGHVASIAVLSSSLPASLQFGFPGAHQVGVAWDGSNLRLMNPLAREGSAPAVIAEAAMRKAAFDLFGGRLMKAIVLAPLHEEATVDPVRDMPLVVADLAGGGSLYGDPERRRLIARTWAGANDVGVYCRRNDLIAIRLDLRSGPAEDLVVGWYGADRIVGPIRVAG